MLDQLISSLVGTTARHFLSSPSSSNNDNRQNNNNNKNDNNNGIGAQALGRQIDRAVGIAVTGVITVGIAAVGFKALNGSRVIEDYWRKDTGGGSKTSGVLMGRRSSLKKNERVRFEKGVILGSGDSASSSSSSSSDDEDEGDEDGEPSTSSIWTLTVDVEWFTKLFKSIFNTVLLSLLHSLRRSTYDSFSKPPSSSSSKHHTSRHTSPQTKHHGSCHCKSLKFTLLQPTSTSNRLKCYECPSKLKYPHHPTQSSDFVLSEGTENLSVYYVSLSSSLSSSSSSSASTSTDSKQIAAHAFCKTCGCHIFRAPCKDKDLIEVNVSLLDGDYSDRLDVCVYDGGSVGMGMGVGVVGKNSTSSSSSSGDHENNKHDCDYDDEEEDGVYGKEEVKPKQRFGTEFSPSMSKATALALSSHFSRPNTSNAMPVFSPTEESAKGTLDRMSFTSQFSLSSNSSASSSSQSSLQSSSQSSSQATQSSTQSKPQHLTTAPSQTYDKHAKVNRYKPKISPTQRLAGKLNTQSSILRNIKNSQRHTHLGGSSGSGSGRGGSYVKAKIVSPEQSLGSSNNVMSAIYSEPLTPPSSSSSSTSTSSISSSLASSLITNNLQNSNSSTEGGRLDTPMKEQMRFYLKRHLGSEGENVKPQQA